MYYIYKVMYRKKEEGIFACCPRERGMPKNKEKLYWLAERKVNININLCK